MRRPKGFGKDYFTLSAIQAYSSHVRMQQRAVQIDAYPIQISESSDDETEEELDELLGTLSQELVTPGGHRHSDDRPLARKRFLAGSTSRHHLAIHHRIDPNNPQPKRLSSSKSITSHTIQGNRT